MRTNWRTLCVNAILAVYRSLSCGKLTVLACLLFISLHQVALANVNTTNEGGLHISLLTCTPGDEIYSAYGHSAIRLMDSERGLDVVFNYGTFDFDTPFFVPKFLCGTLDYMLSASNFSRFLESYRREGRGVEEREVILSSSERREIELFLFTNLQPENRFYRYDFFFDNCATRIRDLFFRYGDVDDSKVKIKSEEETFRDCLHQFVGQNEWWGTGIDLILGVRADARISEFEKAMLPKYLDLLLANEGLLREPKMLLERKPAPAPGIGATFSPRLFSIIMFLAILAVCVFERRRGVWVRCVDYTLFSVASLLALLFWFLWVVSDIKITSYNMNALWASALYVPILFLMSRKRHRNAVRLMAKANVVMIVAYAVVVVCGVQYGSMVGLSASAALLLRNLAVLRHLRTES